MNLHRLILTSPDQRKTHCVAATWPGSTQPWPSLFKALEQQATKLVAQIASGGRGLLPYPAKARAAQTGASRIRAKSLSPFFKVQNISHWGGSLFVDETKFNRSTVA